MDSTKGPAQALYERLTPVRQPFLDRARLCSLYTIPPLIPPQGTTGGTELYKPWQSIGSRGVNNVSSKLAITLIPPTKRFFRLIMSEAMDAKIPKDQRSEWELALSRVEQAIVKRMESLGLRTAAYEAIRHLVVGGNSLVNISAKGIRVFPLSQYVVRRDPEGNVLDVVVEEQVDIDFLPDEIREQVLQVRTAEVRITNKDKTVSLFTHVYREGKVYKVYQEICGLRFNEGSYGTKKCPWVALRWNRNDGEDYGRSHCDDFLGDLQSAEVLSRSIVKGAAIAAKVVFMVNPNGMTDVRDLEEAEEGDFVPGQKADVEPLGLEKFSDFQIAQATLENITSRLAFAFLLNSAVRRDGERVTAEEIRFMAQDTDTALGGTYSLLSVEFQLAVVEIIMSLMEREGSLPHLPEKSVQPTIVTGIDALGRSYELTKLDQFLGGALQTFGPEVLRYVNLSDYLKRRATGLDLDPDGLIKSDQQLAQEQQQQAAMQMTEKLGPPVIKAASDQMAAQAQTGTTTP